MSRQKSLPLEDLFEIAALLPWWARMGIAVVAYFVCHSFATAEIAVATKLGEFGQSIGQAIVKMIASIAQYVLLIILLAAAAASAFAKAKYRNRFPLHVGKQFANGPRPNGAPAPKSMDAWPDQHGPDNYPI